MGNIVTRLAGALSLGQILTFVVGTVGVFVIKNYAPAGLQEALLAIDAQVVAIIAVLTRKPSAAGGTVSKAK